MTKKDIVRKTTVLITLLTILMVSSYSGKAQSKSTDKQLVKEVEIDNEYTPTLRKKAKISTTPQVEVNNSNNPSFEYSLINSPQIDTNTLSNIDFSKVLTKSDYLDNSGYLKLSFGSNISPYAKLHLAIRSEDNTLFTGSAYHSSSLGDIRLNSNEKVEAKQGETAISAGSIINLANSTLNVDCGFTSEFNSYFGTIDSLKDIEFVQGSKYQSRQVMNQIKVGALLSNREIRNSGIGMSAYLRYVNALTMADPRESTFSLGGDVTLPIGIFDFVGDIGYRTALLKKVEYTVVDSESSDITTLTKNRKHHYRVAPAVQIEGRSGSVKLGFSLEGATNSSDNNGITQISPLLAAKVALGNSGVSIFADVKGGVDENRYRSILEDNIWSQPTSVTRPTYTSLDAKGGFYIDPTSSLTITLSAGYKTVEDQTFYIMPFKTIYSYIPDGIMQNTNIFDIIYDDYTVSNFTGSLKWISKREDYIKFSASLFNYSDMQIEAWGAPKYSVSAETRFNISESLAIKGAADITGERKAAVEQPDGTIYTYTMKEAIVIDLGAEYKLPHNITSFIEVNNILDDNYEIEAGYNAFGLEAKIGAYITF